MVSVIEVKPEQLSSLYVNGLDLPYVEFDTPKPALKLIYQGEEFAYWRTVPLNGYGSLLAQRIRELAGEGKKPLLARFGARIYIYATGVVPIGSGKPPAA